MKIIFLDVDGVLNKKSSDPEKGRWPLSRSYLRNLSHLVKETGSRIVLTSDWRRDEDGLRVLKRALRFKGIRIMSQTEVNDKRREEQIQDWLKVSILPIENFLIIDDLKDGLSEELALEAIRRLNA